MRVHVDAANGEWGKVVVHGDDLRDPAGFLLSFGSATIPLRAIDGRDDAVALGDSDEPLFVFDGDSAAFRRVPRWRRILANFLMMRVLRLRSEFLFFHAASVGIRNAGVMLVGPKGTGKSTLSLALAARGHAFYGDEMAVYNPIDGMLLPFRRPVGIKPGPRASAIESALSRTTATPDEEGMLRIPVTDVLDIADVIPQALRTVIFLKGFGPSAAMQKIEAGRDELASMQPIAASMQDGTKASHVFQMIRLLSHCQCYHLTAGGPDETAALVERQLELAQAP